MSSSKEVQLVEFTSSRKIKLLYSFFETYGKERFTGLSEGHFSGLSEDEKEEAWNFLKDGFQLSSERLTGLYMLDKVRAVNLFKVEVAAPIVSSPFPAEQQALEGNRLLMLRYICNVEPDEKYVDAICRFATNQFPKIRAEFAQSLPTRQLGRSVVDALKGMIFTETERVPLTSAITKFMAIHGMDYDMNDPLYKSIYLLLRSENRKEKIFAMRQLEKRQSLGQV
jgi:hypothetical protein